MSSEIPQIFIVDNEIEICNLLKDFFDFVGYNAAFETSGEKALRELESLTYDILFVDLRLDTVSGIDILKKSRQVHPLSEVIIITGYGTEDTILEALRGGAFVYILKPISFTEIRIHSETAIARRQFNLKTEAIRNHLEREDGNLARHFQDIIHFDTLSRFLNLSIDIDTLSESILSGIASLVPGNIYAFLFFDEINKEMVISSPQPVGPSTLVMIRNEMRNQFEKIASVSIGDSYHLRPIVPPVSQGEIREISSVNGVFVPILIENTIHGILGVLNETIADPDNVLNILRNVALRISIVLSNATVHRNTKLLALTDGLTGLLNRSAFHERLDSEFQRFKRYGSFLSLIVADLDNLKEINDTMGHTVGDEVLRTISDIIRETTRDSDILTRYGGDEFVLVLPQTNAQNARNLAERIRVKIGGYPFNANDHQFHCTMSFGVSTAPSGNIITADDLLDTADRAMYESKRSGRNLVMVAE